MKPPMKSNRSVALALCATAFALAAHTTHAAPNDADSAQPSAQAFPKNLARQHLGANLLLFNPANQTYAPTEAAAAWLDDDVATGWPATTGHQHYLVSLAEPQLITNFCISARSTTGTVSLYAGDEAAPPTAKSWYPLAKNVPVDSINEKLGKAFGRFAKYVLIETDLSEASQWYSVYLYGEKAAVGYRIKERAQPVDPRTIYGPYVNAETNFSLSSLYAHGSVVDASADENRAEFQKAIDDNPETGIAIAPSEKEGSLVIRFDKEYAVQRISVLTDGSAKGRLDCFLITGSGNRDATSAESSETADARKSDYIKVRNDLAASAPQSAPAASSANAVSIEGKKPVATINFDGTSERGSADFTPVPGTVLIARWTPDTAGQRLAVREVNSFSDTSLSDHELLAAEVAASRRRERPSDGKEALEPVGEGKEELPQEPPVVGEFAPPKTPFIPGLPPFPPHTTFSPTSP
jgi:hypothetical protein